MLRADHAVLRAGLRVRRALVVRALDRRLRDVAAGLEVAHPEQRQRFDRLAADAGDRYASIADAWDPGSAVEDWRGHIAALERDLLPAPPWTFLRHPRILMTMVNLAGRAALDAELAYARSRVAPEALAALLAEDPVGRPVLVDRELRTSQQAVHHLHHLLRFEEATGAATTTIEGPMVEFGGGYGAFARLYRRRHGGRPTQVLVDLPLFSLLQWLFLASIFGEEDVVLADAPNQAVVAGKINVVPVGWLEEGMASDGIFVSTWALSESPATTQDRIFDTNFLAARHLLLAHQRSSPDFPAADRIGAEAVARGASSEPVGVLAGSSYVFR